MPTVLITGAGRGLGLEFVTQYVTEGYNVIATCRNPDKAAALQELAAKNPSIHIETLDILDTQSIKALADRLKVASVDILLNNAGIISGNSKPVTIDNKSDGQNFGFIDPEAWSRALRMNTIAPIMVVQAFTPHLMQGTDRKVVSISSKMGSISGMGHGYIAYRTSKAALNAAMSTISADLTAKKITWVNLHPGWVKTDMGGPDADLTPQESVTGMRKVIAGLTIKNSGHFLDYAGKTIPW